MSRCFPFPPPNYSREKDLNRDLRWTESIKESLSKEKMKDKMQKRKEKKVISRDVCFEKSEHGKHSRKKQKLNDADAPPSSMHLDSKAQLKKKLPLMEVKYNNNATEPVKDKLRTKDEGSGITEERTLQVVNSKPCESSESTENSSKAGRKFEANNTNRGNSVLPLGLHSQKQIDEKPALSADLLCTSSKIEQKIMEATKARETKPCFYVGQKMTKAHRNSSACEATYFVGQTKPDSKGLQSNESPCISSQPAPKSKGRSVNEAPCSSGHATKAQVTELQSNKSKSKRGKTNHKDTEHKVKELIFNWKPEPMIVHDEEDSEWLFSKSTKQSKGKSDSASAISDVKSCAESKVEKSRHVNAAYAFQPGAQFLPELDMHVLPYVVSC